MLWAVEMNNNQLKIMIRRIVTLLILVPMLWYQMVVSAPLRSISIAVVPMDTNDEYWKSIHAGAVKAAQELKVDVIWKGPAKRCDRNAQIDIVESMVNRRVSGIVLAPLDETALRSPVENAFRTGIPVVVIDSSLKGNRHVSFVATDNYNCGCLAAKHLFQFDRCACFIQPGCAICTNTMPITARVMPAKRTLLNCSINKR